MKLPNFILIVFVARKLLYKIDFLCYNRRTSDILDEEEKEEDSGVCLEEQIKQTHISETISGNISDEDDIPQPSTKEEHINLSTSSVLPSLVADYGTDDDGINCCLYYCISSFLKRILKF